jgi:hypothetical protein
MQKEDLLKRIATSGYNVGFGAKKHFATFDIVQKAPGIIGFISMAIGIFALFVDVLASKQMSGILIVSGVLAMLISLYNNEVDKYDKSGKKLTQIFNDLYSLYLEVKTTNNEDLNVYTEKLAILEKDYYSNCISKQILFSDWYAHYKFFWQHQIVWIDEQLKLKFLRDKVPLSLTFVISILLFLILGWLAWRFLY